MSPETILHVSSQANRLDHGFGRVSGVAVDAEEVHTPSPKIVV